MNLFANKHVITALIVAPVLAVVSYFAVDSIVKEQPQSAVSGQSYPLVAQSNCRFTSGQCDLKNADFLARVSVAPAESGATLVVKSDHPLSAVHVGFSRDDGATEVAPRMMTANVAGDLWTLPAPLILDEKTLMMIVLQANSVKYYADTTMAFVRYETSFNKNF